MKTDVLPYLQHQNFVCVYRGLSYVGQKLETYTRSGIDRVFQRIYKKLAGNKPCHQRCSEIHGNNTKSWCQTCKEWKQQLQYEVRYRGGWDKKKSWEWPKESYGITEMFLPSWWSNGDPNLQDISTACNVWLSCKNEFHIKQHIVRNLHNFRNIYFAHNPQLQVNDYEKAAVFDTLRDLIKDDDVSGHINVQQCLQELEAIQNEDQTSNLNQVLNELREIKNNVDLIDVTQQQLYIIFQQTALDLKHHEQCWNDKIVNFLRFHYLMIAVIVANLLISIVVLLMYSKILDKQPSPMTKFIVPNSNELGSNCLSEIYMYPFQQDLPLLGYLKMDNEFVGREWLIKNIEHSLLNRSDKITRGVVVVADMGYGKSALVSHLLCAKSSTNLQTFYEHIVAFHVCKFYVSSTRKAERFIRRLVGFFATKSAAYGNIISRLPNTSILYSPDACSSELEACFDQGITLPLKEIINTGGDTWIIVLDALDECYEKTLNTNQILELLSSRSRQLPYWVKFLITSRNMSELSILDKYSFQHLSPSDPKNIEDIKLFMERKFSDKAKEKLKRNSWILNQSEGIFLYVITFLELNGNHEYLHELPTSLAEIYELNFRRLYDNDNYSVAKKILEIISAQIEPIHKKHIYNILNASHNNESLDSARFAKELQKLSSFIHDADVVTFKHQAFLHWLIHKKTGRFSISVANGHMLISNYLMSSIKQNATVDIVDLVIHVAQSEDEPLRKLFINLYDFENKHKHASSILHRVIWKTSSVDALKLLMHHYPDFNAMNEGDVIPAFVAAAKGHLEQLKYLQSKGGNMSFIVPASYKMLTSDIFTKIDLIKTVYYSGYSLMHIAAQHGHLSVVEYLIDLNRSMIALKNSVGSRPIDIACENGHLDIVKKLYVVRMDFLSTRCLFYASKYNHKDIVEYVVDQGFKMNCISDGHSRKAINNVFTWLNDNNALSLPTSLFPNDSITTGRLKPIDSWWVIFKETPLHVAIRAGYTTIAILLLKKFPDTVSCVDGFGFTPALTAVAYNRTELMPLFSNRIEQERCSSQPIHLMEITKVFGNTYIRQNICPENATFAHLVAVYDLFDMVLYSIKERLHLSWNNPDASGNCPVHYAASRNSIRFIGISRTFLQIDVDTTTTRNGSTAFHIAALTGAYLSIHVLRHSDNIQMKIEDIKDKQNRGILHYIVLQSLSVTSDLTVHYRSYYIFTKIVEECGHDIRHHDNYKRNILHYAFANGHALVITYLREKFITEYHSLLDEEDLNGLTPVQYSVLKNDIYTAVLPQNCIYFNIFLENFCPSVALETLMPYWEVTLIRNVFGTRLQLTFIHRHAVPYLHEIIRKAVYLTVALFVYHTDLTDEIWKQHTLKAIRLGASGIAILSIIKFRPHIVHTCGQALSVSPLHLYMLKSSPQSNIFAFDNNTVNFILAQLFPEPMQYQKFGCSDINGYNIFHYSLMSGNIVAANVLLRKGIKIVNNRVSYADIFFICLLSKRQLADHQEMYDTFLSSLVVRYSNNIKSKDLCRNDSLSIVHLLSLSGMEKTLQKILEIYGAETLDCSCKYGISPLYLAKLFGENQTVAMLSEYIDPTLPDKAAEEYVLLSLLNNFPLHNIPGAISLLINPYRGGVKNKLRHFWRVFALVESLDRSFRFYNKSQLILKPWLDIFQYLLLYISRLETIVFNKHKVIDCQWIHHVKEHTNLCQLYAAFYLKNVGIISATLKCKLKVAIQIADIVLKDTVLAKSLKSFTRCAVFNKDPRILQSLYHCLILLTGKVIDVFKHVSIYNYILELKNSKLTILTTKFDFMRSRQHAFQDQTKYNSSTFLEKPIELLANSVYYLDIIKATWAYKAMSQHITYDFHGLAGLIPTTTYEEQYKIMTDPFLGLRLNTTVEP